MRHISCCQGCLLGNKTAGVEDVTSKSSSTIRPPWSRKAQKVGGSASRLVEVERPPHVPLNAHPPHMLAAHRVRALPARDPVLGGRPG